MSAHTNFRQGQPVFVQLKTGEKFVDRFHQHRSTHIVLRNHGRIDIADIRAVSINRSTRTETALKQPIVTKTNVNEQGTEGDLGTNKLG